MEFIKFVGITESELDGIREDSSNISILIEKMKKDNPELITDMIISIFFLPDTIPTHFSDGAPGNYSSKFSIFLWPLIQMIIIFLGENRKMLPSQLEKLLSETQYNWAIFGMVLFVFFIELLIVYVVFAAV